MIQGLSGELEVHSQLGIFLLEFFNLGFELFYMSSRVLAIAQSIDNCARRACFFACRANWKFPITLSSALASNPRSRRYEAPLTLCFRVRHLWHAIWVRRRPGRCRRLGASEGGAAEGESSIGHPSDSSCMPKVLRDCKQYGICRGSHWLWCN